MGVELLYLEAEILYKSKYGCLKHKCGSHYLLEQNNEQTFLEKQ